MAGGQDSIEDLLAYYRKTQEAAAAPGPTAAPATSPTGGVGTAPPQAATDLDPRTAEGFQQAARQTAFGRGMVDPAMSDPERRRAILHQGAVIGASTLAAPAGVLAMGTAAAVGGTAANVASDAFSSIFQQKDPYLDNELGTGNDAANYAWRLIRDNRTDFLEGVAGGVFGKYILAPIVGRVASVFRANTPGPPPTPAGGGSPVGGGGPPGTTQGMVGYNTRGGPYNPNAPSPPGPGTRGGSMGTGAGPQPGDPGQQFPGNPNTGRIFTEPGYSEAPSPRSTAAYSGKQISSLPEVANANNMQADEFIKTFANMSTHLDPDKGAAAAAASYAKKGTAAQNRFSTANELSSVKGATLDGSALRTAAQELLDAGEGAFPTSVRPHIEAIANLERPITATEANNIRNWTAGIIRTGVHSNADYSGMESLRMAARSTLDTSDDIASIAMRRAMDHWDKELQGIQKRYTRGPDVQDAAGTGTHYQPPPPPEARLPGATTIYQGAPASQLRLPAPPKKPPGPDRRGPATKSVGPGRRGMK